jgi:uncharacterized protein
MEIHNEFFVNAPLERAWDALLDIQTVAGFLPGATIEPSTDDGAYRGRMKIKVGPVVTTYQGTARLGLVDAAARTVEIEVRASDAQGQGTASAVIRNVLTEEGGGTRVTADTELQVTGRQAQFGRGLMQDVAGRTLDEFARRFEAHLATGGSSSASSAGAPPLGSPLAPTAAAPAHASNDEEALDLGAALYREVALRYAAPVIAVALVLVWLARRRSASSA